MPLCINWFFIAILSQTSNLPQSEVFVNDWEWIEGTRWVGSVLAFDNQQNIIVKPSKGKTVDKGINGVGNQTVFSDTEIVGGSFKKVNDLSNDFKANQARLDLYEILKTIFKNSTMPPWGPKGITGGWGKHPFKKNIAYGNICAGVRRHGNIIKEVPPDDLYYYKNSEIKIDLNYLKIVENGHGFEMTGSCSYKIEIVENLKVTKKYEEKDVPVKFIASRRPAQPNPSAVSNNSMTPSEKFDKDVLDAIIEIFKDNPGKTDLELQKAAERIRSKEGDSPKWVAVEHYFFALHYTSFLSLDQSPTGMTAVIPAIGGTALGWGWEAWQLSFGNTAGAAAQYILRDPVSRWPGPRGDFRKNIVEWGTLGTMGWRPPPARR
jgi:hypothetical protein